jgi:hypothetical protein
MVQGWKIRRGYALHSAQAKQMILKMIEQYDPEDKYHNINAKQLQNLLGRHKSL